MSDGQAFLSFSSKHVETKWGALPAFPLRHCCPADCIEAIELFASSFWFLSQWFINKEWFFSSPRLISRDHFSFWDVRLRQLQNNAEQSVPSLWGQFLLVKQWILNKQKTNFLFTFICLFLHPNHSFLSSPPSSHISLFFNKANVFY